MEVLYKNIKFEKENANGPYTILLIFNGKKDGRYVMTWESRFLNTNELEMFLKGVLDDDKLLITNDRTGNYYVHRMDVIKVTTFNDNYKKLDELTDLRPGTGRYFLEAQDRAVNLYGMNKGGKKRHTRRKSRKRSTRRKSRRRTLRTSRR